MKMGSLTTRLHVFRRGGYATTRRTTRPTTTTTTATPLTTFLNERERGRRFRTDTNNAFLARTAAAARDDDAGETSSSSSSSSFADLGVPKQIVDALRAAGIEKPSVAQLAALPELIDSRTSEDENDAARSQSMPSIAMQSHTGSGKTLAYLIPIFCDILREEEAMEKMDRNQKRHVNDVRTMIVAPSQELAMQIVRTIETVLGPYGRDITQQLIGGANARRQEQGLRKKRPFIVVGTPGRIAEMSRMGVLKAHGVSTLVIDEADDLLASNFRRDMARINEHCGKGVKGGRRTIICSATLRKETLDAYAYGVA